MSARMHVCPEFRAKVLPLVAAGRLDVELVEEGACDVRVQAAPNRREARLDTLYAGGWIACGTAWGMAGQYGLGLRGLGELFETLDIKVRRCSLGCFP